MWATVARASSLDGGQPAKRNSQLQWRRHPSGPHGLHNPPNPRPKRLRIVGCAGVGRGWVVGVLAGACCAARTSKAQQACLSCPARSASGCAPLAAHHQLSNTLHGEARPGLADEVTGRGRGDGVGEVTRCQPGLPFPPPRWAGASRGRSKPVVGSRHRETLTGRLGTHKIHTTLPRDCI